MSTDHLQGLAPELSDALARYQAERRAEYSTLDEQRVREIVREELAALAHAVVNPTKGVDDLHECPGQMRDGLVEFIASTGVAVTGGEVSDVFDKPSTDLHVGRDIEAADVSDPLVMVSTHDSSPSLGAGSTESVGVEGAASGDTGAAHLEGGAR